jgi:hypothetical protein
MASTAYLLMQEFAAEATRAGKEGDFERKFVYDNAEGLVNNVMHGRPFPEVASTVRAALLGNAQRERAGETERQHYLEAVELLDLFIAVNA